MRSYLEIMLRLKVKVMLKCYRWGKNGVSVKKLVKCMLQQKACSIEPDQMALHMYGPLPVSTVFFRSFKTEILG